MRVEIRRSGGPVCHECGSYELVTTTGTGEPLAADISDALARLDRDIGDDLRARYEQLTQRWRRDLAKLLDEHTADAHTAMLAALDPEPSAWHPWKRKWRAKALGEIEQAATLLRERTYLA
jgi:hypothetical protein